VTLASRKSCGAASQAAAGLSGRSIRAAVLAFLSALPLAAAPQTVPAELKSVGIDEHINQPIGLDLTFLDENGRPVALKQFFRKGRPVLLDLVYYECPMLCTVILNGQSEALKNIPWTAGNQFDVVTISFNPADTPELARQKRAMYLANYGRPSADWHFLVDNGGNVKKLADQLGFHYRYDDRTKQFAHAAAIMFLTPGGRISRYLYGVKFNPRDVRLALAEASESKFAFSPERILLYCFHYDPQAKGYVLFATNVMKAGGVLTVLVLSIVLFFFWRRERRTRRAVVAS
jgi:protein SCO1/2